MCLAVPLKLLSRTGSSGWADLHGNRMEINTDLVPDAIPGDWVLVHAGFAIQRMGEQEARATFDVLRDVQRSGVCALVPPTASMKRRE